MKSQKASKYAKQPPKPGNRKPQITILLIFISFLAAHLCFRLLPGIFETWDARTIDQLFRLRSNSGHFQPRYDNTIVHVDLTNTSIQRLNSHYLNRSHFAKVINNLTKMHVSAQVYDFIFAARMDEENDLKLINASRDAGSIYFGAAFELLQKTGQGSKKPVSPNRIPYLDQKKWRVSVKGDPGEFYTGANPLITFPDLASSSKGIGSLSVKFDRDGLLRRIPLLVRYNGAFYPLLPFMVICDYLHVPPEKIHVKPGNCILLKDALRPGQSAVHDIAIPIDRKGNMIVNFIGPWERMDHYNFVDILKASDDRDELEMWEEELRGKIIVVSDVSTGSTDIGPVPTDANFPLSGVHANIMHGILTESFLRELSPLETIASELLLLFTILFLSLRFSSLYFSIGTIVAATSYIIIAGACFMYFNLITPMIRPLLMVIFSMILIVVYRYINEEKEKMEGLRQRDFIRSIFGRYLSREVVEELLGSPGALEMSGELREITFLVSDLRGFTALSSRISPNEVITILNRYFQRMIEIISKHGGTVNEFQGDGILAFFGAPFSADDDPQRAVTCAIEMQNTMKEVNEEQRRLGLPELSMGIGINTGEVIVGNIGSKKRAKYGAVGSPINTAFRIESYTVGGQILICPDTCEKIKSLLQVRGTKTVGFKGIDRPVTLYDVAGMGGEYKAFLPEREPDSITTLENPLPVHCYLLEEKTVSEIPIKGSIIRLGKFSAEVSLDRQVTLHANLKVLVAPDEFPGLPETYAKAVLINQPGSASSEIIINIEFTWLPAEVKEFLAKKLWT